MSTENNINTTATTNTTKEIISNTLIHINTNSNTNNNTNNNNNTKQLLNSPTTILRSITSNKENKKEEIETIYTSDSSEISVKDSLTEGIILKAPDGVINKKVLIHTKTHNSTEESTFVGTSSVKSLKDRPLPILFHQLNDYNKFNQKDDTIFNSNVSKKSQGKNIVNINYFV